MPWLVRDKGDSTMHAKACERQRAPFSTRQGVQLYTFKHPLFHLPYLFIMFSCRNLACERQRAPFPTRQVAQCFLVGTWHSKGREHPSLHAKVCNSVHPITIFFIFLTFLHRFLIGTLHAHIHYNSLNFLRYKFIAKASG